MIILASNSPRRKELLSFTGWYFIVQPASMDESIHAGETPLEYVMRVAKEKASHIMAGTGSDLVIAADTIVVDGTEILGKPETVLDAERMLQQLRGRQHLVYTALVILQPSINNAVDDICTSRVEMREFTDREIKDYIKSGDPMDKAGAYAVQNHEFNPVINFRGCFANVMGLPLCHLKRTIAKFGVIANQSIPDACRVNLKYDCPIYREIEKWKNIG